MTTFSYTSGNPANLTSGASASMTDIQGSFTDVSTFLNSRTINEDNLPVSLLQKAALNDSSGQKGRGKTIIATTESRTNVAYGTMPTPDQVSGIVLPTDGLIGIAFQATWQESVNDAARAAIFIGSNQLTIAQSGVAAPLLMDVANPMNPNLDAPLSTGPGGLMSTPGSAAATAYGGDVTTGQVVGNAAFEGAGAGGGTGATAPQAAMGGFCWVFAAAGTYTISVQFKSSSGSVTVKNRRLWVRAEAY